MQTRQKHLQQCSTLELKKVLR